MKGVQAVRLLDRTAQAVRTLREDLVVVVVPVDLVLLRLRTHEELSLVLLNLHGSPAPEGNTVESGARRRHTARPRRLTVVRRGRESKQEDAGEPSAVRPK